MVYLMSCLSSIIFKPFKTESHIYLKYLSNYVLELFLNHACIDLIPYDKSNINKLLLDDTHAFRTPIISSYVITYMHIISCSN